MPFVNGALKAQHAKLVTVVGKARKEAKREVRNMEVKEDLKKALEAKLKVTTNENKALYAKIDALTTQTVSPYSFPKAKSETVTHAS